MEETAGDNKKAFCPTICRQRLFKGFYGSYFSYRIQRIPPEQTSRSPPVMSSRQAYFPLITPL